MYTVDVVSYTQVGIMQPPSHERYYYYFLQRSQQDYHAWSKQTRAGKLTGLMLLLNHLQKDVSSRTAFVDWLLHLGQIKFNRCFLQSLAQCVLTWHWGIDLI